MRINITGKNIELTDGIKTAVTDKLSKLDKYFADDTIANVTLSVEKDRGYYPYEGIDHQI